LAVISVAYLAIYIPVYAVEKGIDFTKVKMVKIDIGFIGAIPILCFAFQCHVLIPSLFSELKNPTPFKMNAIIFSAVLICGILYTPVGFFGYLAFGENECGDVLNKFFSKNVAAGIGRIVVMITVTISYPLNNFPARQALAGWITGDSKKEVSTPIFIFLTLFLFALNLVIAIFVKNINIVFFFGRIDISSFNYIHFPSSLHMENKQRE